MADYPGTYPIEVTLTDGSRWIIYYRGPTTFAACLRHIEQDVQDNRLMSADDPDRVQRRFGQILMGHVVSIRDATQCTCPDIDVSVHPCDPSTVKGLDPHCPAHRKTTNHG